jgi:hypothetical protein
VKNVQTKNKSAVDELVAACREHPGLDPRDVLVAIADPQWGNASRKNDWRMRVDALVIDLWGDLSLDAKLALYLTASSQSFLD